MGANNKVITVLLFLAGTPHWNSSHFLRESEKDHNISNCALKQQSLVYAITALQVLKLTLSLCYAMLYKSEKLAYGRAQ